MVCLKYNRVISISLVLLFFIAVSSSAMGAPNVAKETKVEDLSAVAEGNFVALTWRVTNEMHVDFYVLERSANNSDYEKVTEMAARGNRSTSISYQSLDETAPKGDLQYRIRTVFLNGKEVVSTIVHVRAKKKFISNISLFPNPAKDGREMIVEFQSNTDREVLVVIQDMLGKQHYSKITSVTMGDNRIVISSYYHSMSPGIYFVVAAANSELVRQKILVR